MQRRGDYIIRFIAVDSHGIPFSDTFSSSFRVSTGKPYSLQFASFLGPAWGGSVIALQPAVEVVDRGGNRVRDSKLMSGYNISVYLSKSPAYYNYSVILHPQRESALTVPVIDGLAQFKYLYIREAGYPYRLTFNLNAVRTPVLCLIMILCSYVEVPF